MICNGKFSQQSKLSDCILRSRQFGLTTPKNLNSAGGGSNTQSIFGLPSQPWWFK